MQVTIDHSQTTKGIVFRTTHHVVSTSVQFTGDERAALMRFGDAVLVGRDPPSTANLNGADLSALSPNQFDLKVSDLVKGTDVTAFASRATAHRYAEAVRDAVAKLKASLSLAVHKAAALFLYFAADAVVVV